MEQVRIGVIGCGGIAQYHFGHLEKIPEANVVAVCDLVEERAQAAAKRFSATPYRAYADMFAKETLDAVYVCVEPSAHDGMELMAIEKGYHLFVQKPMALNMAYCEKVRDALQAKGLISAVGLQCRYAETLPRVKAWLDTQEIGMVAGFRLGGLPMVWWWRQHADSGGQLVEQAIHDVDLLRYLLGEPVAVTAMRRRGIMTHIDKFDTDDASAATIRFESGIVVSFMSGCFSDHGVGSHTIEFYTKQGKLSYGIGGNFTIRQPNLTIEGKAGNDWGQECDDAFIEAVLNKDQSVVMSPYADACKTMRMVLAASESMDAGGKLITLA